MKINYLPKVDKLQSTFVVSIRLAKLEDAKLVLKIYNASVKGGFFGSKNLIVFKDYIKWFKKN